jgi:hypothetical protein
MPFTELQLQLPRWLKVSIDVKRMALLLGLPAAHWLIWDEAESGRFVGGPPRIIRLHPRFLVLCICALFKGKKRHLTQSPWPLACARAR